MTTALLDRLSAPAPATPAALPRHYLLTRFRALALFGRRPAERVVRSVLPASENLHNSRLLHCSKTSADYSEGINTELNAATKLSVNVDVPDRLLDAKSCIRLCSERD
jgi:hypothetical protein